MAEFLASVGTQRVAMAFERRESAEFIGAAIIWIELRHFRFGELPA